MKALLVVIIALVLFKDGYAQTETCSVNSTVLNLRSGPRDQLQSCPSIE